LVNNCTIDWFENWNSEALESVAYKLLEDEKISYSKELSIGLREFHENA